MVREEGRDGRGREGGGCTEWEGVLSGREEGVLSGREGGGCTEWEGGRRVSGRRVREGERIVREEGREEERGIGKEEERDKMGGEERPSKRQKASSFYILFYPLHTLGESV